MADSEVLKKQMGHDLPELSPHCSLNLSINRATWVSEDSDPPSFL